MFRKLPRRRPAPLFARVTALGSGAGDEVERVIGDCLARGFGAPFREVLEDA